MRATDRIAVELVEAAPTPIAAVRRTTRRSELGNAIMSGLDAVYALLRGRGATGLGHNVVVYRRASGWQPHDTLDIEVGVQTPTPIAPEGEVLALATPGGRAASATHVGPYQTMGDTTRAIRTWIREQGLVGGIDWEVYGDWEDDPAKLTTQIFIQVREGEP